MDGTALLGAIATNAVRLIPQHITIAVGMTVVGGNFFLHLVNNQQVQAQQTTLGISRGGVQRRNGNGQGSGMALGQVTVLCSSSSSYVLILERFHDRDRSRAFASHGLAVNSQGHGAITSSGDNHVTIRFLSCDDGSRGAASLGNGNNLLSGFADQLAFFLSGSGHGISHVTVGGGHDGVRISYLNAVNIEMYSSIACCTDSL